MGSKISKVLHRCKAGDYEMWLSCRTVSESLANDFQCALSIYNLFLEYVYNLLVYPAIILCHTYVIYVYIHIIAHICLYIFL